MRKSENVFTKLGLTCSQTKVGNGSIVNFRKAWNKACRKAKLGYGLSKQREIRSGVAGQASSWSNLSRFPPNGNTEHGQVVPEQVAMMISGHRTRSVFDRYNIVNDADLRLAAQRQHAYLESQLGTITDFDAKKEQLKTG